MIGQQQRSGTPMEWVASSDTYFDVLSKVETEIRATKSAADEAQQQLEASAFSWLPTLFGSAANSTYDARIEFLQRAKKSIADQAPDLDEQAYEQLGEMGLKAIIPEGQRSGMVAILQFVRAWESHTGLQFRHLSVRSQAYLLESSVRTLDPRTLNQKLRLLRQTPPEFLMDFKAWPAMARVKSIEFALERAAAFEKATGAKIRADDLPHMSDQSDTQFHAFLANLATLRDAGWTFDGSIQPGTKGRYRTAITVFYPLATTKETSSVSIQSALGGPERIAEVNVAGLVNAAERLESHGIQPSPALFEFGALLALPEDDPAGMLARAVLDRIDLDTRPGAAREIAALLESQKNDAESFLTFVDAVKDRLGRKLTTSELRAFDRRHRAGESLDDILPPEGIAYALEFDAHASAADIYLWSRLDDSEKARTREDLVTSLRTTISSGPARADVAAEYDEDLDANLPSLTLSDLQRMSVLLATLKHSETRTKIAQQALADAQRDDTELGGAFMVDDGVRTFRPLEPDVPVDDNTYVRPHGLVDPFATFVTAHIHAAGRRYAGPSSASGGFLLDRGFVWDQARPDIVITHLGEGTFGVDYYTPNGSVVDLGVFSSNPNPPA